MSVVWSFKRQIDGKFRKLSFCAVDEYSSLMRLYHLVNKVQAQSEAWSSVSAAALCCRSAFILLENDFLVGFGYAQPIVAYFQDGVAFAFFRRDVYFHTLLWVFDGIINQIA